MNYWHNIRRCVTSTAMSVFVASALAQPATGQGVSDVLLQTMNGKIVTGVIDDASLVGALGERVHQARFLSNYRSADPGFVSLATGNPNLPSGVQGFPADHDVSFDFLAMTLGQAASNLLFWDGSDADGDGLALDDVDFAPAVDARWEVFDDDFSLFSVNGDDQGVPGGLVQETSSDIDPDDGIDAGAIHNHLVLQLQSTLGVAGATPPEGVYMVAWQARAEGFETSDPFLMVHRTSSISDEVHNLAADWARENLEMLTSPVLPGDYDGDGDVDGADFQVWRSDYGSTGMALRSDGNTDEVVDGADYTVWRDNLGATAALAPANLTASTVPEPAAALIAGVGVCGLTTRRRHR